MAAFPETGVVSMLAALSVLFDPDKNISGNTRIMDRVTVIRDLVGEGYIPRVGVVLCNNGARWTALAQQRIETDPYGQAATWLHLGPDQLVNLLRPAVQIDATLWLSGAATVESFDFRRALVGRIAVGQLAALFETHGDRLLDRNIRRYVGLTGNRVNEGIAATLSDPQERQNFYFYNNGITIICNQFRHTAMQQENWHVQITGLQIINGGQTCRTIQQVVRDLGPDVGTAQVMLRIYELPQGEQDLVQNITFATNSQNPVSLRDLKSNDRKQKLLEQSINELGFGYRRQRSDAPLAKQEYEVETVAKAVFVTWRKHKIPRTVQSAFDEYYDEVFTDSLNGAQAILAVRIMEMVDDFRASKIELLRKKSESTAGTEASGDQFRHYIWQMFIGNTDEIAGQFSEMLLQGIRMELNDIDHKSFEKVTSYLDANGARLFDLAYDAAEKEKRIPWERSLVRLKSTVIKRWKKKIKKD